MSGSLILADNRFLDGVPVATGTEAGYDALHVRDLRTYTHWRAETSGLSRIAVDCTASMGADTLAVARHNLGTVGSQVSVESSDDGVIWTTRASVFVPATDRPLLKRWGTASARHWRVSFNAQTAAPQVAVLMIGRAIAFPRRPDAPFAWREVKQESDRALSKSGQLIGVVARFKGLSLSPQWSHIEAAFVDNQLFPFYRDYAGAGNPFFWSWDPDTDPGEVYFVRLREGYSFAPAQSLRSHYDRVALEMEGILE
ncbi:MAG: hypothetical protein OHK0028_22820 [Deltaproteobacteria bacterium]